MNRANALRSSVAIGALLRVAMLTTVGAICAVSRADAQGYYWRDSEPGYYQQQLVQPPPRRPVQHSRRAAPAKKEVVKDTAVHPKMPLIINVSIARQRVRVYDANGFFAEAPVSTGMPGHPTPMGVFSVIQKDRYHHSNIYSNAPMPFMQRITWGGVALHAGVLPGYPASHGCIRMPESFAIKMWGWTKMGARVIVTPGELSPESFSHPLLPIMKVVPQPAVAQQPETDEPLAVKADKGAPELKPIEANLELRTTVGHSDNLKPAAEAAPPSEQSHTADASGGDMQAAKPETAKPDADSAKSNAGNAPQAATEAVGKNTQSANAIDAGKGEPGAVGKPAAVADAAKPDDTAAHKPTEDAAKPAETASAKPAKAEHSEAKPETATVETAKPDAIKPDTAKLEAAKAEPPAPKAEAAKAENTSVVTAADAKKDQTRIVDISKPAIKPRREGQLAVFISRKDSKLYVRQNFAPLFEVPVTIAPSDRPLGTHVFTATVDKNDSNAVHWTVVTVPMSARAAMRASDEPRSSRHHHKGKSAAPVEAKAPPLPDSPTEALDRIGIPADVMARISETLATGDSIVVSDQGINQGETGEYTDFIVRTY